MGKNNGQQKKEGGEAPDMGVYASRIQGKEQPTNLACQYQFITSIPSRISGFSFFFFLFTSCLEPSPLPLGLRVFSYFFLRVRIFTLRISRRILHFLAFLWAAATPDCRPEPPSTAKQSLACLLGLGGLPTYVPICGLLGP